MTAPYDVRVLANWVLDRAEVTGQPTPTNMAINKIVYFLYEKMLVESSRVIALAKIEAWEHGPVFRELYSEFRKHGEGPITSRAQRFSVPKRQFETAKDVIDIKDQQLFADIVDHFLPMSAAKLRRISHQPDSPWFKVWTHAGFSNPGMEITPEIIDQSFSGFRVIV